VEKESERKGKKNEKDRGKEGEWIGAIWRKVASWR